MKVLHKILGGINLTWLKVIILAVVTGIYTGLINQVPFLLDTSFRDIAISFEVWIFFGIFMLRKRVDSYCKLHKKLYGDLGRTLSAFLINCAGMKKYRSKLP